MHIPENYLSPETCAVLTVAMVPAWTIAMKKVRKEIPQDKITLLGVAAALSFLAMMFNLPLPGGTTGHAVSGVLAAILFGPWGACLAISAALIIQAVFFGDGGILAIGANCFNMAVVLPFTGYFVYNMAKKAIKNDYLAAGIAGYAGINAAAFVAAVEFGIQPMLFHDAAGQALYCPYPLSISIPAMMAGHITLFGLAEAVFTAGVLAYVKNTVPEMLNVSSSVKSSKLLYGLIGALIVATPLGLIAEGTAWGEWGTEEMAELTESGTALGYTPAGMLDGFEYEVMIPDYALEGMPDVAAYILSAVIGTALMIVIFRLMANMMPTKAKF